MKQMHIASWSLWYMAKQYCIIKFICTISVYLFFCFSCSLMLANSLSLSCVIVIIPDIRQRSDNTMTENLLLDMTMSRFQHNLMRFEEWIRLNMNASWSAVSSVYCTCFLGKVMNWKFWCSWIHFVYYLPCFLVVLYKVWVCLFTLLLVSFALCLMPKCYCHFLSDCTTMNHMT